MKIEVHFTMKGIPGSIRHTIEVDTMEDKEIKKALIKEVREHLTHAHETINQVVLIIFFIKELTS